MKVWAYIGHCV